MPDQSAPPLPPDLVWLIERLGQLSSDSELIWLHAVAINSAVGAIRGRQDRRGYRLEQHSGRLRRVPADAIGVTRSLEQLRRAAKSALRHRNDRVWMAAWTAAPQRARRLIWNFAAPPIARQYFDATTGELIGFQLAPFPTAGTFNFTAAGLAMTAPRPAVALPRIENAIQKESQNTPAVERRKRKSDELVANLSTAICAAFTALSGGPAPKPVRWLRARLDSPLIQLARDVSEHFAIHVFNVTDSPRLRKLSPPKD